MMKTPIIVLAALATLTGSARAQQALPTLKLPDAFFQCEEAKDCAIAGDACRSCGELVVINKKFLKKFNALDQKERAKRKIVRACEACGTRQAVLACVENRCRLKDRAPKNE